MSFQWNYVRLRMTLNYCAEPTSRTKNRECQIPSWRKHLQTTLRKTTDESNLGLNLFQELEKVVTVITVHHFGNRLSKTAINKVRYHMTWNYCPISSDPKYRATFLFALVTKNCIIVGYRQNKSYSTAETYDTSRNSNRWYWRQLLSGLRAQTTCIADYHRMNMSNPSEYCKILT